MTMVEDITWEVLPIISKDMYKTKVWLGVGGKKICILEMHNGGCEVGPWGDAGDKWKFVSGFLSAQLLAIEMLKQED